MYIDNKMLSRDRNKNVTRFNFKINKVLDNTDRGRRSFRPYGGSWRYIVLGNLKGLCRSDYPLYI